MSNNKIFKISLSLSLFFIGLIFFTQLNKVSAQTLSLTYPRYDVNINIKENTIYTVEEDATYTFTGNLNGIRRDITLYDSNKNSRCVENPSLTCGGFEFLILKNLVLDDKELDKSEYKTEEVTDESQSRFFRIEKRLFNSQTYVENESFNLKAIYDIYGGIQWLRNENNKSVPYFYWNILPERRNGLIKESTFTINFPETVELELDKFKILGINEFNYTANISRSTNTITVNTGNLPNFSPVTVIYEFNEDELIKPGELELDLKSPIFGLKVFLNNEEVISRAGDKFLNFPAGNYQFKFTRTGYKTLEKDISVNENTSEKIEISLQKESWMELINVVSLLQAIAGLGFAVYAIYFVSNKYNTKGTDKDKEKTIVPQFSPPKGVSPYLLGSIIDEKVDKKDISGSVIDLAYRGFIKIREIKKNKNYELTRVKKDKEDELNQVEKDIIDMFFGSKDSIKTNSLKNSTTIFSKYKKLQEKIYNEMVEKSYFEHSPNTIRTTYLGMGIFLSIVGVTLAVAGSFVLSVFIGEIEIFSTGFAIFVLGIGFVIASPFMPSKTSLGSKVYADILGFKMYLTTAEKYRLQNLKPEYFEKYLSYAVVLGVEKQWAKSFKDIYKDSPDWYEGQGDIFDAIILTNMINNFNTTAISSIKPASSGTGSGWSGGGSFGGFSGGGGGGGSSGGF